MDQGVDGASVEQPGIGRGFSSSANKDPLLAPINHKPQAFLPLPLPLPLPTSILCPECGSSKLWRDGRRLTDRGFVQRWLCRKCGYRFSLREAVSEEDEGVKESENETKSEGEDEGYGKPLAKAPEGLLGSSDPLESSVPIDSIQGKELELNSSGIDSKDCQVCVPEGGSKNLAAPIASEKQGAGATERQDQQQLLMDFALWMKRQGYAEVSIESYVKLLRILRKRGANLYDPESFKEVLSEQSWSNKRKTNAVNAYSCLLRMKGGSWTPPKYKEVRSLPFIPTEGELDALIAACGPKTSTFLALLKETAMRAGEAIRLKWTDIDFQTGTVRIAPEKGSKPRIFKLSSTLLSMLSRLKGRSSSNRVFGRSLRTQRRLFSKQRSSLARKLQNPRLLQIHFHTFRHWKATMLYHQTKDILYVMNFLGHRNIMNTLTYVQLEEALFKNSDEGFICKAASSVEEAKPLIEAGFDYVCEIQGVKLFRKRK